ncbi:MAG: ribosome small subunit-dependent GTPase A, partial [Ottowia sp.]|nr:ribosome small subunit-dependent GTPase A [Ottowia sp.]
MIAGYGRHYLAETAPGVLLQVFARGKHSLVAVGDQVALCAEAVGQASIQSILPRRNLLYRSDAFKSKLLAANIDQVIIVLATEPSFSEDLLARSLIAAHAAEITPLVLLNKTDLQKNFSAATVRLQPYRTLGYTVLALCAQQQITTELLKPYLLGKTSILIGQSGMGKSTLLNLLVPDAAAHTREISEKLDSGKHT